MAEKPQSRRDTEKIALVAKQGRTRKEGGAGENEPRIGAPLGEASAAEILGLLVGGTVIELDNGWQLTTARIAGDEVVEVVLNGLPANRAELERYGLSEEIIGYKRRWFVVLEEAPAVLPVVASAEKADPGHHRHEPI